jgi:L-lactate dehydrogenase (cytochrome)
LGAKGVLLGRAWAFALAAGGGAAVGRMLDLLRQELIVAMALTGQTDVSKVSREALVAADLQKD